MKSLKISTKLLILVFIMSLIIGIIGINGERNLKNVNASVETIYKDRVIPLKQLKVISDRYAVDIVDAAHKTRNGNTSWETGKRSIKRANEEIEANWKTYLATYLTPEERSLANEAKQLMDVSNESIESLQHILQNGDSIGLTNYIKKELYSKIDPITSKITELTDLQLKVAQSEYTKSNSVYT